jgi:hypothetical protein
MFKREIIQVIGNYRASEAEEYDLWLRMINAGYRLYRTASPWVLYRVHTNQASQTPGFVERGSNCSLVQSEQLKLAGTLDLASDNIQEIRSKALAHVSGNGILARLELAGLSNFRSLFFR